MKLNIAQGPQATVGHVGLWGALQLNLNLYPTSVQDIPTGRQASCSGRLTYSVALVRKRTIPTERPPLVGEVSANFCG
jgi:hypothetical protein